MTAFCASFLLLGLLHGVVAAGTLRSWTVDCTRVASGGRCELFERSWRGVREASVDLAAVAGIRADERGASALHVELDGATHRLAVRAPRAAGLRKAWATFGQAQPPATLHLADGGSGTLTVFMLLGVVVCGAFAADCGHRARGGDGLFPDAWWLARSG